MKYTIEIDDEDTYALALAAILEKGVAECNRCGCKNCHIDFNKFMALADKFQNHMLELNKIRPSFNMRLVLSNFISILEKETKIFSNKSVN